MHQSVIMCLPTAVVAGWQLRSGEAREVAQHAALDSAYTALACCLFAHWLFVLEFSLTRARLLQTWPSRQS